MGKLRPGGHMWLGERLYPAFTIIPPKAKWREWSALYYYYFFFFRKMFPNPQPSMPSQEGVASALWGFSWGKFHSHGSSKQNITGHDVSFQIPVACKSCPCGFVFISRKLLNAKVNERSSPAIAGRLFYHFVCVCLCLCFLQISPQLYSGFLQLQGQIKCIFLHRKCLLGSALFLTSIFPEQADFEVVWLLQHSRLSELIFISL